MKIYFIKILLICTLLNLSLNADPCTSVVNPTSYKDCSPFVNNATQSICCWVVGVYGGTNGTACLPVDSLFTGKSISYTLDGLTSNMFCGDQVLSSKYLSINFWQFFILLITYMLS